MPSNDPKDDLSELRWSLMQPVLAHGHIWPDRALAQMCSGLADALAGTRWCYVVTGREGPAARAPAKEATMGSWKTLHIEYDSRATSAERQAWEQMRERVRFVDDPGGRALVNNAGGPRLQLAQRFYAPYPNAPIPAFLTSLGIVDRVIAAAPLNPYLEIWVIIDRTVGDHFGDDDASRVEATLPLFAQGAYRLCLHRGWLEGAERLTPRESETLTHLLSGLSEAQCAEALGLSVGSTHQIVVRIFRKLGVRTRPELMALCLGPMPPELGNQGA